MTRRKLYIILSIALAAGFALLFYEFLAVGSSSLPDLCMFKQLTGVPCPSCGSTRSIVAMLNGHFTQAFMLNPAGFLIAGIMLSAPVMMFYDLATGKRILLDVYLRTESFVRRPVIALTLVCIVIANWIWNIVKGI